MLLKSLERVKRGMLDLIYPPQCLHCNDSLKNESPLLCSHCLSLMTLIDPASRCPLCFSSDYQPDVETICQVCRKNPYELERIGAAFDYFGPAATLVTHLKYGKLAYLSAGMGAYLAAQLLILKWPLPDLIVPMPLSRLKKWERGFNQSSLLAEALSLHIERPVVELLSRRSGEFSQAGMSSLQRQQLSSEGFVISKTADLKGKTVLVIDDVMTTGSSMRCCADKLRSLYPESIYALTFCRAL